MSIWRTSKTLRKWLRMLSHIFLSIHSKKEQEALFNFVFKRDVFVNLPTDRLPYRQKFLNDRNSKICYHSLKDHPKVSKIAKFRCDML